MSEKLKESKTVEDRDVEIAYSQFLTDVMTAAGLLSCGKKDKQLAKRLSDFCVSERMKGDAV